MYSEPSVCGVQSYRGGAIARASYSTTLQRLQRGLQPPCQLGAAHEKKATSTAAAAARKAAMVQAYHVMEMDGVMLCRTRSSLAQVCVCLAPVRRLPDVTACPHLSRRAAGLEQLVAISTHLFSIFGDAKLGVVGMSPICVMRSTRPPRSAWTPSSACACRAPAFSYHAGLGYSETPDALKARAFPLPIGHIHCAHL